MEARARSQSRFAPLPHPQMGVPSGACCAIPTAVIWGLP